MTNLQTVSQLLAPKSTSPELDALCLIELVTSKPRWQILTDLNLELDQSQTKQLQDLISRRSRLPIAYLTKTRDFYGRQFVVDPRVLIPRPESEALVDLALGLRLNFDNVYDLGCGSGCLGLSYAQQTATLNLYLIDNSLPALQIARLNCHRLGRSVTIIKFDLDHLTRQFFLPKSLILANLPYLDRAQKDDYYRRCPDLRAEPDQALFSDQSGLGHYRRLFARLAGLDCHLIIEAPPTKHVELVSIAQAANFKLVKTSGFGQVYKTSLGAAARTTSISNFLP